MYRRHIAVALSCTIGLGAATVRAQSLHSDVSIGVSNLDYGGDQHLRSLVYDTDPDGGLAAADLPVRLFAGLDGSGNAATLAYSASASAWVVAPGLPVGLHVAVQGRLEDTFYNPANPPFFDATVQPPVDNPNGVPDNFYAYGKAGMVELLSYGGFGAGQYYARYIYRIHGHVTGRGFDSAFIVFQVGSHAPEFAWFHPNLPNGEIVATYATNRYLVGNGMSHEQRSDFYVWFGADTQSEPEGSTVAGAFDFGQTITLDRIEVVDEDDNPVYGWTVEAASGLDYDLPLFRSDFDPVQPEPESRSAGLDMSAVCAKLHRASVNGAVIRRDSSCDGTPASVREVRFRPVNQGHAAADDQSSTRAAGPSRS
ncbi:MAG: hypothetical protein J0H15_10635 [Xanthomonadales bacterium]|nr:hypothetical protein [Xanthomonadales bacterium]